MFETDILTALACHEAIMLLLSNLPLAQNKEALISLLTDFDLKMCRLLIPWP